MWMCDNARFTQSMYQDLAGADSYSCLLMHEMMPQLTIRRVTGVGYKLHIGLKP